MINLFIKKSSWKGLLGVFLGGIFICVSSFVFVRKSDIYSASLTHIQKSESIKKDLGAVQSVYMTPWALSFRVNGADGRASLTFYVVGSEKSKLVKLYLKQEIGIWEVKNEIIPEN